MPSHATRNHLAFPVAAVMAVALVSVPPQPGAALASVPTLIEVSAIRLQAEVTSYVSGLNDAVLAELAPLASEPAPAATTDSPTYNPNYTPLDNVLWTLPLDVRNVILPGLYVVAWVLGAVMAVVYTVIGWDKFPLSAAATAAPVEPAASVEPTTAVSDPDPNAPSSAPGATENAGSVVANIPVPAEENTSADSAPAADPTRSRASQARGLISEPVAVADDASGATDDVDLPVDATEEPIVAAEPVVGADNVPAEQVSAAVNEPADTAPSAPRAAKRSIR